MNLNKIKNYSSTNIVDKHKNPIAPNDILLSCGALCIYLKESDKKDGKIYVSYTNGKISKINPKNSIRIDTEIELLKSNQAQLTSRVIDFEKIKQHRYNHLIYKISGFMQEYINKSIRLFKKRMNEGIYTKYEINPENYTRLTATGYVYNDEIYTDKTLTKYFFENDKRHRIWITREYNVYYLHIISDNSNFANTFNTYFQEIKDTIVEYIENSRK